MSAVQQYCDFSQDTPCAPCATRAFSSLSGKGVSAGDPPAAQSNENMHGEERAIARADLMRVVVRYRDTDYEVGSAAGKWVQHETRLDVEIDIEKACAAEVCDAIALADLRRAINKKPNPRRDVLATPRNGQTFGVFFRPLGRCRCVGEHDYFCELVPAEDSGAATENLPPLRCVAPRSEVVQVVRVRPSRPSSGGDSGVRAWRGTVGWCLKPLPPVCVDALFSSVDIAAERVPIRNHLQAARSLQERARSGGRRARRMAADAEAEVHRLEAEDRGLSEKLDEVVAGDAHRAGLVGLEREIYRFPDRPAVVFGGLL